jgi:hypothetical protein
VTLIPNYTKISISENRNTYRVWVGKSEKERSLEENLSIDWRITLKNY